MITARPGSHTHRILQLLSASGEFPASALPLLGNGRVLAALVHKLESAQDIRLGKDGPVHHVKLLQASGKGGDRTIRLYKKGLPVLDGLHPGLLDWYLAAFNNHNFTGDRFHIWRNHRVAEALAMCMSANIEARPYALEPLQKSRIGRIVPGGASFYVSRYFKKTGADGANKTMYTRIVGALFHPGGCYAVYNTRGAIMKWSGRGEIKALNNLLELARMNAGLGEVGGAILFGKGAGAALDTILESDKGRRADLRFDQIYKTIHFVPLDQSGIRLLKLLVLPDWNWRLLGALFSPSQRSYNRGSMEYDAIVGGRKILSHLDGDIARLIRFREALCANHEPADVLCYPWQTGPLRAYLGKLAGIRELGMEAVEAIFKGEAST